jgi:hypothetical protein
MENCKGCRFWLNWDTEDTNLGECHRFPPRMMTVRETGPEGPSTATVRPEDGGWPLTYPDDWCGEFQHSPTRPAPSVVKSAPQKEDTGPEI